MSLVMPQEMRTGPLPVGWIDVALTDICQIVGGGTPSTKVAEYWEGDIPWISSADIYGLTDIRPRRKITEAAIRGSATNMVAAGAIVVVTRVGLGKVAIAHRDLCFSQDSQGLVFDADQISGLYLTYFLSQAVQNFRYEGRGTTISGVTKKHLGEIQVLIPPLLEQRRIVAEIEKQFTRLDASVAALRRTQANLKRYRASVLRAVCSGELVPTEAVLARAEGREYEPADVLLERILAERRARWEAQEKRRGKYKEPAAPETSDLPPLPEGWEWVSFEQLITTLRNGYSKRPEGSDGIPILRISAVRPMNVNTQDMRWVNSTKDLSTFLVNSGDLLFTRYNGNPSLVGVCGVVPRLNQKLLHPDKLIRAVLLQSGTLPEFVQIVANAGQSRVFLSNRVRTTAGQAGISGTDVKQMPIPLPPHAEQQRIVAEVERRLSVIQRAAAAVEASLQRAERLRQSILKQAFSGELVPQDPDDEPASVLLERIRAQREAEQAAASVTKKRPARRRRAKATAQQLSLEEATA